MNIAVEKTVKAMAEIAHIALKDGEEQVFVADLERMEDDAARLARLEVDGVEPLVYISPVRNVMRQDEVAPSLAQSDALANAPKVEENCFWVPRILED